jgi:uncharacterized membrane protein YedE/YeeE
MVAAANDSNGKRVLGLLTGAAFGALLQRGRLSRYEVILGQLLLRDGRVAKAMGAAVVVGAIGVHALVRKGLTTKDIKPMKVAGVVGGAAMFGGGLALLGYCPGTAVAALGEGRRDALAGVIGMLLGAGAFVALYPKLKPALAGGGDFGKMTLPGATASPDWAWVTSLAGGSAAAAGAVELLGRAR